jgi:SIR2-like domain
MALTLTPESTEGAPTCESQRQALRTAVNEAYEYIDEKVRGFSFRKDAPYPVNIYLVQEFISKFSGTSNCPGFFFTVNQDLFVERQYYTGQAPTLPGIQRRPSWFTSNSTQSLKAERCIIPELASDIVFKDWPFFYVKLHGSSNWYTGDRETMVIGRAKHTQIAAHAILGAYFDAFRSVLSSEGRRLLCVGYGFSDEHVNAAIADGVREGLRVYVLSPESPDQLAARLRQQETGNVVWRGLAGYFQYDLKTLFPADQSVTAEWKLLQSRFLTS